MACLGLVVPEIPVQLVHNPLVSLTDGHGIADVQVCAELVKCCADGHLRRITAALGKPLSPRRDAQLNRGLPSLQRASFQPTYPLVLGIISIWDAQRSVLYPALVLDRVNS